jgi:hypothetical protein
MSKAQEVIQALKEGHRVSCIYNGSLLNDITSHMIDHYEHYSIQVDISEGFMKLKMTSQPRLRKAGSIHGRIHSITN